MSAPRADLCELYIPVVFGGWLDPWTYIQEGAYRGPWPCTGSSGGIDCTCTCHTLGPPHEMPERAGRTAIHPTEVLADAG